MILSYLRQTIFFRPHHKLKSALIIFITINLIIFLLGPKQFDALPINHKILISVAHGIFYALAFILTYSIFPKKNNRWTRFDHLKAIITGTFITILCLLISKYILLSFNPSNHYITMDPLEDIKPRGFLTILFITGLIYTALNYSKYMYFIHGKMNNLEVFPKNYSELSVDIPMLFEGRNKKEFLQIQPNQFICIKSEGHYVKVYFLKEKSNDLNHVILRNTLKDIELQILSHHNCYRCHKSYIINLNYIKAIEKKAHNFQIQLSFYTDLIPISNSKVAFIKKILDQLKETKTS